ncbi:MAG: pirin family protein [Chitinophagaceae bacterium]|nr:pirin family protein [Chitinophagaceae bacterium]
MQKNIDYILAGREKNITKEEVVLQPLPHKDFRFANPFIVLHHMLPETIPPGSKQRIHPHPHRGFAPVTIMLQGEGYHKDNAGHDETVSAGDVQWMFAGKGLLHSEGPTDKILKEGGVQELIQLWINVPAKHKWNEPSYQSAKQSSLPEVLVQEGASFHLISGKYDGSTGPLKSFTPVILINGTIQEGKRVQFSATPGYWTLMYVISGTVCINNEVIAAHNLIIFEKNNEEVIVHARQDTRLLFLSAEPINEPVAAKDNFVMNTAEEVNQAMEDYKNGIFGTLNY